MAFLAQRIVSALWPRRQPAGTFDSRELPECVVLPVVAGTPPSGKPPVRIYLGTELAQHRAERVFIWSVQKCRDPARVYEIYLMKELAGFDRRWWLTGFTNYRFAIPEFAGGSGRAIYNDEDQVYLSDPGLLFDLEMDGHGYLSVSDRDTSVMLIDCARMANVWNRDAARRLGKNRLLKQARRTPGLWGLLAPEWNARDDEYIAGRSHLLHYTALHTQPWRPFPRQFAYQASREGSVWHNLERSANEAGFEVFTAGHPSHHFLTLKDWINRAREGSFAAKQAATLPMHLRDELSGDFDAGQTDGTLQVGLDDSQRMSTGIAFALVPELSHPTWPAERHQRVLCMDTLEYLPDEDIPWFTARLFASAGQNMCVTVQEQPAPRLIGGRQRITARPRSDQWWIEIMERAADHFPGVHWKLIVHDAPMSRIVHVREAGNLARIPKVWVLNDHKPGHAVQGQGLAEALGWPYEAKRLHFTPAVYLHRGIARLLGLTEATGIGLTGASLEGLKPPWPELVIAAGWKPARIARWISRRSHGRTRVVLLGRKGAPIADGTDILISCAHFNLPAHPLRIETTLPPNRITAARLKEATAGWESRYPDAPHPRIGLLLGGSTELQRLGRREALQLGRDVRTFADTHRAHVYAITSRRTGHKAIAALRQGLGHAAMVHEWHKGEQDNPYLGFLGACDVLIVTGDSESMISEAVASGKPLLIYPLPFRRTPLRHQVAAWVVARANARPVNWRGTTRPQQGLEYLCARLIERNIVQPPRDLPALYRALVKRGRAVLFHVSQSVPPPAEPDAANETFALARAVRQKLRFTNV